MSDGLTPDQLAAIEERAAAAPEGPWRTFPNPMRSDGVFVAQDRPIEPYPGNPRDLDGNPHLPAVPKGWCLGSQVEHAAGAFIAASRTDVPLLCAELRAAQERTLRLESVLRSVEWIWSPAGTFRFCPSCGDEQSGGHRGNCLLAAALRTPDQPEREQP